MKKIFILILLVIVLVLLVRRVHREVSQGGSDFQTVTIGSQALHVEVVRSTRELSKGLGERNTIGSDGMLFVLPVRIIPTFWMKDMRFGLDFVWIDGDRVVALTPNVPAEPGVSDISLKVYSPGVLSTHVLELPLGDIEKHQIHIGDPVQL